MLWKFLRKPQVAKNPATRCANLWTPAGGAKWQWTKKNLVNIENIARRKYQFVRQLDGWFSRVDKGCKLMNMECCNRCFFWGSWFIEKEGPWCNTWMFGAPLSM